MKGQMTLQPIEENLENVNTVAGNSDDTNTSNDIFVFVCAFYKMNFNIWD